MTDSHRNYYIFLFYLSWTLAILSKVEFLVLFPVLVPRNYQESSSNATFFYPRREYVTVNRSRILALSSPSEGSYHQRLLDPDCLLILWVSSVWHTLKFYSLFYSGLSLTGSNSSKGTLRNQFQFQYNTTAIYDVRVSWLSSTNWVPPFWTQVPSSRIWVPRNRVSSPEVYKFQFHQNWVPLFWTQVPSSRILVPWNRVPSSEVWKFKFDGTLAEFRHLINWNRQIYRTGSLTQTFPGDSPETLCESATDSDDLFSSLWGNYLATNTNLLKFWVPRKSAHCQFQESMSMIDLKTPVCLFVKVECYRRQSIDSYSHSSAKFMTYVDTIRFMWLSKFEMELPVSYSSRRTMKVCSMNSRSNRFQTVRWTFFGWVREFLARMDFWKFVGFAEMYVYKITLPLFSR